MDFYSSLNSSQLNTQKPTLFEVVSCAQLDSLLSPSLRFLLAHYTHRYPRLLIRVLNNFDELNSLLWGFIQYKYLETWNATFIEKFYGIKRISSRPLLPKSPEVVAANPAKYHEITKLSSLQILLSLIDTVGIPYLSTKLQLYHEQLIPQHLLDTVHLDVPEEEKSGVQSEKQTPVLRIVALLCKLKKQLKEAFFKLYPSVKLSLKLFMILLHILYLSDKTSSVSIIQLLSKVSYARITRADHLRVESRFTPKEQSRDQVLNIPPTLSSVLFSNIQALALPLQKIAWATTDTILPVSIFLLKFLEWYNANRSAHEDKNSDNNKFIDAPVPPIVPPDALNSKEVKAAITTTDAACRICHEEMHNPAIIETGYVFCYKCIYEYLRDQPKETGGRCPVTGRRLLGCSWGETRNEWIIKGLRRVII